MGRNAARLLAAATAGRQWYFVVFLCRPSAGAIRLDIALRLARTMERSDFAQIARLIDSLMLLRQDLHEWWDAEIENDPKLRAALDR